MSFRDEALTKCLESLSDRERRVLEMRFGLNGEPPRSLDEVGRAFYLSRERIPPDRKPVAQETAFARREPEA
jgi:DNA-directed RNA polymerase sigma subunit (sigma70/sigma32)